MERLSTPTIFAARLFDYLWMLQDMLKKVGFQIEDIKIEHHQITEDDVDGVLADGEYVWHNLCKLYNAIFIPFYYSINILYNVYYFSNDNTIIIYSGYHPVGITIDRGLYHAMVVSSTTPDSIQFKDQLNHYEIQIIDDQENNLTKILTIKLVQLSTEFIFAEKRMESEKDQ